MNKNITLIFLRILAPVVMLAGAVGSLGLMFNAGRNQKSIMLIILFAGWVLSPFMALFVASRISRNWPVTARLLLYCLMLILAVGSLLGYSGVFSPQGTRGAFVFLVVPFFSWIVIGIFSLITRYIFRRMSRTGDKI